MKALPFAKSVKRPAWQAFRRLSYIASPLRTIHYKYLVTPAPDLPRFLRLFPQKVVGQGMRFVVSACVTGRRHRKLIRHVSFAKHQAVLEAFIFTTTALDHMHSPVSRR